VQRFTGSRRHTAAREIAWRSSARRAATTSAAASRPSSHELPGRPRETRWRSRARWRTSSHSLQNGRTDAVYLVYNEFKSAGTQRVVVEPLLPMTTARSAALREGAAPRDRLPLRAVKQRLLDALLPMFVESQIYRGLLESMASEFGARMTAMDNATSNAKEMISR
jgi:ATP synthase F1 gamma subunit